MLRRALVILLAGAAAVPAAAPADDPVFAFGRLLRSAPDSFGRVGVKVSCLAPEGCNLELILATSGTKRTELGRVYTSLIGDSTEVNYVALSKSRRRTLARHKRLPVVFTANVTVPNATGGTFTKSVTLRAPVKKTR